MCTICGGVHHDFGGPGWFPFNAELATDHEVHCPDRPGIGPAGVLVEVHRYDGMFHGFIGMLGALQPEDASRVAFAALRESLRQR